MKVLHIINNLEVGGAEMMLLKLLTQLDQQEFQSEVIALIGQGLVGPRIEKLGVPVQALGFRQSLPRISDLWRLRQQIAKRRPDVIQTWMFHSDLLGGMISTLVHPRPPVVWNIRHCNLSDTIDKRSTIWTVGLCSRLSWWLPRKIVINSMAGRDHHVELGYAPQKFAVIPNGFDLSSFIPRSSNNVEFCREINVPPTSRLVGHMGRYDLQKDHVGFIRAAGKMAASLPDVRFVMCGRDVTMNNPPLAEAVEATGFVDRFRLLDRRDDMPRVQAAMSLVVSSSSVSEGFPNVIGEAMACGVPCVVTGVGGSPEVVGETGRVVPPSNPDALAAACVELLSLPPTAYEDLSRRVRQRVEQNFDIRRVAEMYGDVWNSAMKPARRASDSAPPQPSQKANSLNTPSRTEIPRSDKRRAA